MIGTSPRPHPFIIFDSFFYQYLVPMHVIFINLYDNFQNLYNHSFSLIEEKQWVGLGVVISAPPMFKNYIFIGLSTP
jgi:hypothetical protein